MSEVEHVHLGARAPRSYAKRLDRIRDEIGKALNIRPSRAQTILMLLDHAMPQAEARFGLLPPKPQTDAERATA